MLIGGRLPPNIIGATLLRPDVIGVLASADEADKIPLLEEVLRNIAGPLEWIRQANPYDFDLNLRACEEFIARYRRGNQLYFNITCGTKVMALAAYEAARDCQDARVFYVDTARTIRAKTREEQSLVNDLVDLGLVGLVSEDRFLIRSNED